MCHEIIQHHKFCLNKYLCIDNQLREKKTMRKVFNLIYCCDEFEQITDNFLNIKGYLHYKTITSQNVLSEAEVKNFFIS